MLSFTQFLLLVEGVLDNLKAANPEHSDTVDQLAGIDHTPTKKYVAPLLKMHISGNLPNPSENAEHISNTIRAFDVHGPKTGQPDFRAYKSFSDVSSALQPHIERALKKKEVRSDAPVIHEDDNIRVRRIDSEPAACKYGAGTKWCVSSRDATVTDKDSPYHKENGRIVKETPTHLHLKFNNSETPISFPRDNVKKLNLFDHYSENGKNNMYTIEDKGTGEKFAYHEGEGGDSVRDAEDTDIGTRSLIEKYPQLENIEDLRQSKGGHNFIIPGFVRNLQNDNITDDMKQMLTSYRYDRVYDNLYKQPNEVFIKKLKNHPLVDEDVKQKLRDFLTKNKDMFDMSNHDRDIRRLI